MSFFLCYKFQTLQVSVFFTPHRFLRAVLNLDQQKKIPLCKAKQYLKSLSTRT
jgi:hypothetical protein